MTVQCHLETVIPVNFKISNLSTKIDLQLNKILNKTIGTFNISIFILFFYFFVRTLKATESKGKRK